MISWLTPIRCSKERGKLLPQNLGKMLAIAFDMFLDRFDVSRDALNPLPMKGDCVTVPTNNVNHCMIIGLGNQFGVAAHSDA